MKHLFYLNTKDARYVVERLKERRKMRGFYFHEVGWEDVKKVNGKGILLWGHGNEHHVSYLFDLRKGNEKGVTKVNIDQHSDMYIRWEGEELYQGNHFLFSVLYHDVEGRLLMPRYFVEDEMMWMDFYSVEFLDPKNVTEGIKNGKVHITLDLDIVNKFPVLEEYVTMKHGWDDYYLLNVLERFVEEKVNVVRLDIGGLYAGCALDEGVRERFKYHYKRSAYTKKRYSEAVRLIERIVRMFGSVTCQE